MKISKKIEKISVLKVFEISEKLSKVFPPKVENIFRKSIFLARHRTDLGLSCPKTCLFAYFEQYFPPKRPENFLWPDLHTFLENVGQKW